ncbi:MAG: NfeD family protein [Verrucomicrobiota bacterium]
MKTPLLSILFLMLGGLLGGLVGQEAPAPEPEVPAPAEVGADDSEADTAPVEEVPEAVETDADALAPEEAMLRKVYVVPIEGPIMKPQLYILRRALKDAITEDVSSIILQIDTPGGAVGVTLEMMEALDNFDGHTIAYISPEAVSAGSLIAASCDTIYMAPGSVVGAAEVVTGTGEDVPEGMRRKIQSYLAAKVRALSETDPLRAKVIRAMSEPDYVLEIDGEPLEINGDVLSEEGTLLTLTASEAVTEVGDPPQRLFADGIFEDVPGLLGARYGAGNWELKAFEVTWSEELAKYLTMIAPGLLTLGILLLVLEFKTPGFGFFGISGIALLVVVFLSNYTAGLAGYEALLLIILGAALILIELLLIPGILILMGLGFLMMLGGMVWMLADVWPTPGGGIDFDASAFTWAILQAMTAFGLALIGAMLLAYVLPNTFLRRFVMLESTVGGGRPGADTAGGEGIAGASTQPDSRLPAVGATGVAVTALFPTGEVEIGGERYEARARLSMLNAGTRIRVTGHGDYALLVEADRG